MRRLIEIAHRCTLDRTRRAWRSCYRPIGGVIDVGGTPTLLILFADWRIGAAFLHWHRMPVPVVKVMSR